MTKPRNNPLATAPVNSKPNPNLAKRTAADTPPIIGIGASAGGLEALEAFLSNVPAKSGLAFIVIQHLDPTLARARACRSISFSGLWRMTAANAPLA